VKVLLKATKLEVAVVSQEDSRRVDITLHGVATFLRLPKLQEVFDHLPADCIIHLHIEDLRYIDHACFEMLQSAAAQRAEQGGAVHASWETLAKRFHLRQVHAS
jgi:hypothetical protein